MMRDIHPVFLGNVWNIYLNYYGASDNQMSATLYQKRQKSGLWSVFGSFK